MIQEVLREKTVLRNNGNFFFFPFYIKSEDNKNKVKSSVREC